MENYLFIFCGIVLFYLIIDGLRNSKRSNRSITDSEDTVGIMKLIEIFRMEETDHGTIGILRMNDQVFCATLELPDIDNMRNKSRIPDGEYICYKVDSPKFGPTYEIMNVPNRKHILFHKGNVAGDTLGCILLGQYAGKLKGDRAVLNSGATFQNFMHQNSQVLNFKLIIKSI